MRVEVLSRPLQAEEYFAAADVDASGALTRHVSLPFEPFGDRDYDSSIDRVAAAVFADLGQEWQIHACRVVCADPRPQAGQEGHSGYVVVAVTIDPDRRGGPATGIA